MKIFSGLVGVCLIILVLTFALFNRQSTVVSLWPLGGEIPIPVYLLTLGMLFMGLFLGALIGSFGTLRHRREANRLRKDMAALNIKLANMPRASVLSPVLGMAPRPRLRRRFWGPQP